MAKAVSDKRIVLLIYECDDIADALAAIDRAIANERLLVDHGLDVRIAFDTPWEEEEDDEGISVGPGEGRLVVVVRGNTSVWESSEAEVT